MLPRCVFYRRRLLKKIVFIVYAVSIVLTGAAGLMLPQFVDISVYSAFPFIGAAYMAVGAIFMYCFGEFNRHTISRRLFGFDFKYSKRGGEGEFDIVTGRKDKAGYSRSVLIYAVISAIEIPFVFFFPYYAKVSFALAVLVISPIIQVILEVKGMSHRIKGVIDKRELEKQELDEQKHREEMGKWK